MGFRIQKDMIQIFQMRYFMAANISEVKVWGKKNLPVQPGPRVSMSNPAKKTFLMSKFDL